MLHPETLQALTAFQKRRGRLLLYRALLLMGSILLALFVLIALLDRLTFMADSIRKPLSYAAWLLTIGFCAVQTWRLSRQHSNRLTTALLMENAAPNLREKLLSAVELAQDQTPSKNDSEEFREQLQASIAAELRSFDVTKTLPPGLLAPYFRYLGVMVILITALSLIPPLHLPGFLARAALPFANIGRPSSINILILSPEKSHTLVPYSSQTLLTAEIHGPTPDRVIIEQIPDSPHAKPTRLEMTAIGSGRYESTLQVEQANLQYRILAKDAITPWHTLETRARPRSTGFTKVITPPEYTQLPPQTLSEDHGDLSALEGSSIEITFAANQPLQNSTATLLPAQVPLVITPKSESNASHHRIQLEIDGQSDAWQLQLTALETGFTNEETTPWRIHAIPDQLPSIAMTLPASDQMMHPHQVLTITGEANDDIGIAKIELSHSINGADGINASLPITANAQNISAQTTLSLDTLPLKHGDALILKLIATDLKGQSSESLPIRLLIINEQADPQQRAWAATQQRLAQQAKAIQQEMRKARRQAEAIRSDKKGTDPNNQNQAAHANLKQHLDTVKEMTEQLWEQTRQAARQAPNNLKQHEIQLVAQQLSALRDHHLPNLQQELSDTTYVNQRKDTKSIRQAANEAASSADMLHEAWRTFASADLAQTANEALEILAPQQHQLAETAIDSNRDPNHRKHWQEKQKAALSAVKSTHEDLQNLHAVAPDNRQRDIQNQINNFNQKIPNLESSFDSPEQHQAPEYLYGQAHELRNATNQARDFSRALAADSQHKAAEMRQRLQQHTQPALATLKRAIDHLSQAATQQDPDKKSQAVTATTQKLKAAADQLQSQSEIREQNAATNTLAALDQNRLSRALDQLVAQVPAEPTRENIQPLQKQLSQLLESARTLEADASLQSAQAALQEGQQAIEEKNAPQQRLNSSIAAQSQLRQLDKTLQQLNAPSEAIQAVQNARNQAERQLNETRQQIQQASQQRHQQQQQDHVPAPSDPPSLDANQQAKQQLAAAHEAFAPSVQNARAALEQMTPKLSELAQATAESLKQNQQFTDALAQQASHQNAEDTASAIQQLLPQAQDSAEKLADLQSALRQETAHANLSETPQRQMARTADIALAQMQRQSPQISSNLQQAAQSTESQQQQQSLQNAANAQQQTANALNQLSENLTKMEQGQTLPEDALAAQRSMEEALGIKDSLDQSYQNLQEINDLMQQAKDSPQQTLSGLEKILQNNPQMQQALSQLSKKSASDTQSNLGQLKSQPQQMTELVSTEAHQLSRVARHQQRLSQNEAAQQIREASQQLQQLAQEEASAEQTENALNAAQQADQAATSAAQKMSAATAGTPNSLLQTAKGAMLAHALDQLDQAVHPMPQNSPSDQNAPNTPSSQQQTSQTQAQQSLAKAGQAQAQNMAQDRAQGKVPGQSPPSSTDPSQQPQLAQPNPNHSNTPPASDPNGQWTQTTQNLAVPDLIISDQETWGRLPAKMAKDLNEAIRQEPSPEYRAAIESYYKAIAEKARQ